MMSDDVLLDNISGDDDDYLGDQIDEKVLWSWKWPRVHENEQVNFCDLQLHDWVPGPGLVIKVDPKSWSISFANGEVHFFTLGRWRRDGYEGVRRRYTIQEEQELFS